MFNSLPCLRSLSLVSVLIMLLFFTAALQVTVDPEQATRYEQSAVTFNCYATGTLFPIRYMWTFDNDPEWNHDQQNLTILSVDLRHDGVYTCHVVTNEAVPQNQSDSAVLVVYREYIIISYYSKDDVGPLLVNDWHDIGSLLAYRANSEPMTGYRLAFSNGMLNCFDLISCDPCLAL